MYELNRTNVPITDPNNPRLLLPGRQPQDPRLRDCLTGYVTPDWQTTFGYAYTDARITSDTSATIVAGNRVQLVPYNQFALVERVSDQFAMWAASLGVIYFSDLFASSDDSVRMPGFWRFDAGLLRKDRRNLERAAQCREHLQQGLLGHRGRQQQSLSRPGSYGTGAGTGEILAAAFVA